MERKVEAVMYCKFNNHDRHAAIIKKNNKGITVVDKPFPKVLEEAKEAVKNVTINSLDKEFIWENIFPRRSW